MKQLFRPAALQTSLRVFLCLLLSILASCSNPSSYPKPSPAVSQQSYLGLLEAEALEKARSIGVRARVVSREGMPLRLTKDHRPDRLNFIILRGKVSKVQKG